MFSASMAPEIIPPMTRVVTYSKSSKPLRSKGGPSAPPLSAANLPESSSQRVVSEPSRGWTGGEFTPASKIPTTDTSGGAGNRTKRYSSQRQRNLPESGSGVDMPSAEMMSPPPTSLVATTQIVSTMLHSSARPIPAAAFFGKFYFSITFFKLTYLININMSIEAMLGN